MKIEHLTKSLAEKLQKTANDEWHPYWGKRDVIQVTSQTNDGNIELCYHWNGKFWECGVCIYHMKHQRESVNLECFLNDALSESIDWDECEALHDVDEWDEHGFSDVYDYYTFKGIF